MRKVFYLSLLIIVLSSSSGLAAENVTQRYEETFNEIDIHFGKNQINNLSKYKVLLVPGFLSDAVIDLGRFSAIRFTRLGEYFDDQMKWLTQTGIDHERVDIESEQSPEYNAVIISAAIKKSAKPVLIMAHSKGGIDALEALLTEEDLKSKVKGFLAIQSPYLGSPVADWVIGRTTLSWTAFYLLGKLGGTEASLKSLTLEERKKYHWKNEEKILKLTEVIPTISFSSWKDREGSTWDWDTLLKWPRNCMRDNGLKSDGLVPTISARIPGSDIIMVPKVDHAVPVMHCIFLDFDRIRFTKTLLSLLLEKIDNER